MMSQYNAAISTFLHKDDSRLIIRVFYALWKCYYDLTAVKREKCAKKKKKKILQKKGSYFFR